jgi:glycine/D-amino acid oxidase-like deaminating enzyme
MIGVMARGAEVVIIGGGIVGLSIAYHLAARRCDDVCVLERGQIGEGSTAKAGWSLIRAVAWPRVGPPVPAGPRMPFMLPSLPDAL